MPIFGTWVVILGIATMFGALMGPAGFFGIFTIAAGLHIYGRSI